MKIILYIVAALIFALAIFFVVQAVRAYSKNESVKPKIVKIAIFAVIAILVLAANNLYTIVPTGSVGLLYTNGRLSENIIRPGVAFHMPFVQQVKLVSTQLRDHTAFTGDAVLWGESSDKVVVSMADVTISYRVSEDAVVDLAKNVSSGSFLSNDLIASALKAASQELPTEDVTNRGKLEPLALTHLKQSLDEKYGENKIIPSAVHIGDMEFLPEYDEAIAKKNNAALLYDTAVLENKTKLENAKNEAEVKKRQAEGDAAAIREKATAEADAIKIKADAEAEANKKLAQSLTDPVLKNKYYEKWNGQLPNTILGDDTTAMVPVK